jgi:hypothetical protein
VPTRARTALPPGRLTSGRCGRWRSAIRGRRGGANAAEFGCAAEVVAVGGSVDRAARLPPRLIGFTSAENPVWPRRHGPLRTQPSPGQVTAQAIAGLRGGPHKAADAGGVVTYGRNGGNMRPSWTVFLAFSALAGPLTSCWPVDATDPAVTVRLARPQRSDRHPARPRPARGSTNSPARRFGIIRGSCARGERGRA